MFIPFYGFRASKKSHGTSLVCWFACFFPNKLQLAKAEFKKYDLVLPRGLPSGELTFCHGKIHHFSGKIHYFYGHFQLLC